MMNGMDIKKAYENCERMQKLADEATLGEWNSFVAKGETRDIRRARLFQCPERFRDDVRIHTETVFRLKNRGKR